MSGDIGGFSVMLHPLRHIAVVASWSPLAVLGIFGNGWPREVWLGWVRPQTLAPAGV